MSSEMNDCSQNHGNSQAGCLLWKKGGMKKIRLVSWLLMFSSPVNSTDCKQTQILLIRPIHGEKWEKTEDCIYSVSLLSLPICSNGERET